MPLSLPRTRRVATAIALALALSGGATACGSDDGGSDAAPTTTAESDAETTETTETETTETETPPSEVGDADRQDYVDALAAADNDFADEAQGQCLAEGWVDIIGVDRLRDAGITPEQFGEDDTVLDDLAIDEATGGEMYDQFAACGVDLRQQFLESYQQDDSLTPAQQACIEDQITDDALRTWFVSSFMLEDETAEDPFAGLMDCFA